MRCKKGFIYKHCIMYRCLGHQKGQRKEGLEQSESFFEMQVNHNNTVYRYRLNLKNFCSILSEQGAELQTRKVDLLNKNFCIIEMIANAGTNDTATHIPEFLTIATSPCSSWSKCSDDYWSKRSNLEERNSKQLILLNTRTKAQQPEIQRVSA